MLCMADANLVILICVAHVPVPLYVGMLFTHTNAKYRCNEIAVSLHI